MWNVNTRNGGLGVFMQRGDSGEIGIKRIGQRIEIKAIFSRSQRDTSISVRVPLCVMFVYV